MLGEAELSACHLHVHVHVWQISRCLGDQPANDVKSVMALSLSAGAQRVTISPEQIHACLRSGDPVTSIGDIAAYLDLTSKYKVEGYQNVRSEDIPTVTC